MRFERLREEHGGGWSKTFLEVKEEADYYVPLKFNVT